MQTYTTLTIRYRSAEPGVMCLMIDGRCIGMAPCFPTADLDGLYRHVLPGAHQVDRLSIRGHNCSPTLIDYTTALRSNGSAGTRREVRTGQTSLTVSGADGRMALRWSSGACITDWFALARLTGATLLSSDYVSAATCCERFRDTHGRGWLCTVTRHAPELPAMVQRVWLYEGTQWVAVQASLLADDDTEIECGLFSPLTSVTPDAVRLPGGSLARSVWMPFKNDTWDERPQTRSVDSGSTSYQIGGLLSDGDAPGALIIGDPDQRLWKTGITTGGSDGRLLVLTVYGGAASPEATGDYDTHTPLKGSTIDSPRVWIGWHDDWRDGLESFGAVCHKMHPPVTWLGTAPIGWSSWGAYHTSMQFHDAITSARYMHHELRPAGYQASDGSQNIHLDAWSTRVEERIGEFRSLLTRQNQTLGAYACPFAYWGDDMDARVWGIPSEYRWGDVVQRLRDGRIHPKLNGGYYPVDPTHPAIRESIHDLFSRFKRWGVRYVKLDFMLGGCCEGRRYLNHIRTGLQAFAYGMQMIQEESVYPDGSQMFLQLEIGPLFPGGYTHSHLVTSDIHHTGAFLNHFILSAATWHWWRAWRMNQYNDAGIFTLEQNDGIPLENDALARSRLTAMVVLGSPLIVCIDPRRTDQTAAAKRVLCNTLVNRLGAQARPFRPSHPGSGSTPCDVFTRADQDHYWVAVFNLSDKRTQRDIDLKTLGIHWPRVAQCEEVWTNLKTPVSRRLCCVLDPDDCALFRFTTIRGR